MTQLILYTVLALITLVECNCLVQEWRTTRNPGTALLGLGFIAFTVAVIGTAIGSVK